MSRASSTEILYRVFRVSMGWCATARSRNGICAFVLPQEDREAAEAEIKTRFRQGRKSRSAMRKLIEDADRYFNGWRTEFQGFALDLSGGTEFQQRAWTIARKIPYGEVRTYRWIGMEMGRPEAARAIGGALGANPVPLIIPCHRVVNQDGTLGGFSGGGPELKAKMLELERVLMAGEGPLRRIIAPAKR